MIPRREKQSVKRAPSVAMRGCVLMRAAGDGVYYSQSSFEHYYGNSHHWDNSLSLTKQCFLPKSEIRTQQFFEMRMASDGVYYSRTDFAKHSKSAARWAAAGRTAIRCCLTAPDFTSLANCTQKLGHGAAAQVLTGDRPIPVFGQFRGTGEQAERAALLSPMLPPCGAQLDPEDAARREGSADTGGGSLSSAPTDESMCSSLAEGEAQGRGALQSAEGAALASVLAAALREAARLAAERDGALRAAASARKAEAAARAAVEAAVQREQALLAELAALRQDAAGWATRDLSLQQMMRAQVAAEEGQRRGEISSCRDAEFQGFFSSDALLVSCNSFPQNSTCSTVTPAPPPGAVSCVGASPPGQAIAPPPQREWTATQVFRIKKIAHWVAGFDPLSWELVCRASLAAALKVTRRWTMAYSALAQSNYLLQARDEDVGPGPADAKEAGPCSEAIYDLQELRDDVKDSFRGHKFRKTFLLRIDMALAIFTLFGLQCRELWFEARDVANNLERKKDSQRYILGHRQQGVYSVHAPGRAPRRARQ